ncbi:MAG TPA: hypothetical protein VMU75_11970 [Acidimicrobiales bacterium]|nr:hypothetical protein [Acidimicrobiales bacterium]
MDTVGSTEVTAEIPALPSGTTEHHSYGVLLPDGTIWYPGSSRRLPAPFLLRLFVWFVFFLLVLGAVGLAVEHFHPTWLSFLRNTASPAVAGPASGSTTSSSTPAASSGFRRVAANATGATYSVPASSYTIELTLFQACWTKIKSPPSAATYLLEQTLLPSESPKLVNVSGSSSVDLAAQASSITIRSGSTVLGEITAPKVAYTYTFVASTS